MASAADLLGRRAQAAVHLQFPTLEDQIQQTAVQHSTAAAAAEQHPVSRPKARGRGGGGMLPVPTLIAIVPHIVAGGLEAQSAN